MRLFVVSENRYCELPSGRPLIVGRQEGNDIRIADRRVSRRHAEITVEDGRVFIRDLGSRAGTLKDSSPIDGRVECRAGESVFLGEVELRFEADAAQASAPAAPPQSPHSGLLPIYSAGTGSQNLFSQEMMEMSRKVQTRVLELLISEGLIG